MLPNASENEEFRLMASEFRAQVTRAGVHRKSGLEQCESPQRRFAVRGLLASDGALVATGSSDSAAHVLRSAPAQLTHLGM
jgi:hypothetical protein